MKKSRVLILVASLLILSLVLCACGSLKAAKPGKVLSGAYDNETRLLTTSTSVDLKEGDVRESRGKFVYLKDNSGEHPITMIYNLESGSTVYTYTETGSTSVSGHNFYRTEVYELGLFTVTLRTVGEEKITYVTSLYNEAGTQIASVNEETAIVSVAADLFAFDDTCYRVATDKTYTQAFKLNDLSKNGCLEIMEKIQGMTESYYYVVEESGNAYAYDKELKLVASYILPSYAQLQCFGILKDGVVFIQYLVAQPEDATDYDLFDEGTKYEVVTELYQVKNQKTKSIETDYLFGLVISRAMDVENDIFYMFDESVDVIGMAFEIKDKLANQNEEAVKYLVMDSKGNVKSSLSDMFDGCSELPQSIAANYYSYRTLDGRDFLINQKGELIGEITGVVERNNKYLITEKKLYNYDLTVAYDFDAEDMTIYGMTNEVVFFEKEGDIYLYNGSLSKLIAKNETKTLTVNDEWYVIRNNVDLTYVYYSANGTQLLSTDTLLIQAAEYKGFFLLGGQKDSKPVYYRFA